MPNKCRAAELFVIGLYITQIVIAAHTREGITCRSFALYMFSGEKEMKGKLFQKLGEKKGGYINKQGMVAVQNLKHFQKKKMMESKFKMFSEENKRQ